MNIIIIKQTVTLIKIYNSIPSVTIWLLLLVLVTPYLIWLYIFTQDAKRSEFEEKEYKYYIENVSF